MNMTLTQSLANYRAMLAGYLAPQRARVLLLAALLLGGIVLQLANPQIIRFFLDTVQSGGNQQALLLAASVYLAFAFAHHGLGLAGVYTGQQVAWRATNQLRRDLTLHILRLDMSFHKQHTPGELIERIDGDVNELSNFLSEFAIRVLGNALLVLGILILLFRELGWVGLTLTAYVLLTLVLLGAVQGLVVSRWAAARQVAAEMYGFIEERISGTEDIRAAGAGAYMLYRLLQYMRAWKDKYLRAALVGMLAYNSTNVLAAVGYALGLALAVWLFVRGQASIGTAYLVVTYSGMLAMPLQALRKEARDLQQSTASIGRIRQLLDLQPKVTDRPLAPSNGAAAGSLPHGALAVEFDNVSFHYEDDADVLRQISFAVQPGRVLGILGRTGSGKTTLTRLLLRLYDPDAGRVRLGGRDLRDIRATELRARVGMVTQEVQLFQASVRDNLTFFNPSAAESQVVAALKELRLWDWVSGLPQGLDTAMAAGGGGLSAGEAQLLAFARVMLKDPGVVVLDEASARLDPATETMLERAVDRLFAGRTAIIIAHRLHTVERADDILIMENGRVIEHGPRQALAADPGSRFYQLLQTGLEAALA